MTNNELTNFGYMLLQIFVDSHLCCSCTFVHDRENYYQQTTCTSANNSQVVTGKYLIDKNYSILKLINVKSALSDA